MPLAAVGCGGSASAELKVPPVTGTSASSIAGTGTFYYRCSGPSDAFCSENALFTTAGIPTLAVGGSADFRFKKYGGDAEAPVREVASKARLQLSSGGRVLALLPGRAGLLGNDGATGPIVDAYNITVESPSRFRIEALAGKLGFHVWPEDADGKPLAGAFPLKWTIDDENVARITTDPGSTIVVLETKNNGKTTLHLAYAGITKDIPVEVNQ